MKISKILKFAEVLQFKLTQIKMRIYRQVKRFRGEFRLTADALMVMTEMPNHIL